MERRSQRRRGNSTPASPASKGPTRRDAEAQGRTASSPAKVLRMLLQFGPELATARVDRLARGAGVPLSSAYRYLTLLREAGLVAEAGQGVYQLTPRVLALAHAARIANGITAQLPVVLQGLREQTGESALYVRRVADMAVCVDLVESSQPVRLSFTPGHPMPLHAGAGAKLLLAHLKDDDQARYLRALRAQSALRDRCARLEREIPVMRDRGWATSEAEVDDGVWAAAAIVRDTAGVAGVLSVAGPAYRLDDAKREAILARVRDAATRLSRELAA
ncbi:MAG TPA: IclR family transcriptional regulator [Burkholderiales bacterium]|nr:IclR family transcriptional regulator [Burkholderiales bacterium]